MGVTTFWNLQRLLAVRRPIYRAPHAFTQFLDRMEAQNPEPLGGCTYVLATSLLANIYILISWRAALQEVTTQHCGYKPARDNFTSVIIAPVTRSTWLSLSVRPSVCHTDDWFSPKRFNVSKYFVHRATVFEREISPSRTEGLLRTKESNMALCR